MICFGKAISGPVTNSAVEMFNLHSLIIGFCSAVANTMMWSTVFCLISPLKQQWNNCKELLPAAQTVIFVIVTLFYRWATHILGTESTAFQLAAQILNHREHCSMFKNTRQLRWLRLAVWCKKISVWCNEVVKLVCLSYRPNYYWNELAGHSSSHSRTSHIKIQIHIPGWNSFLLTAWVNNVHSLW